MTNQILIRSVRVATLALALVLGFAPNLGVAKVRGKKAKVTEVKKPEINPSSEQLPLDKLSERLYALNKFPKARQLKGAYDLLQKKKFKPVRSKLTMLQKDPVFGDVALWLSAQADILEARQVSQTRKFSASSKLAQRAILKLFQIESQMPGSPYIKNIAKEVGQAELLKAQALFFEKNYAAARLVFEAAFQRLGSNTGLSVVRKETLEQYVVSCQKAEGEYCTGWMRKLNSAFAKASEEAKYLTKTRPEAFERPKPASVSKLTQSYKSPDADQVAFDSAIELVLEDKNKKAAQELSQFMDEFPRSTHRYRARYWHARILVAQKENEKSVKALSALQQDSPLTYYGLTASLLGGKSFDETLDQSVPKAVEIDPYLNPNEVFHLMRAKMFLAEKAPELAATELKELRISNALSNEFLLYLSELNFEAHSYHTSFQLLTELIQRGFASVYTTSVVKMIFPVAFFDIIEKQAAANNLDPVLVLSLMKQESAFDPAAMSGAGASGLMQLMPFTAVETEPTVRRADLVDPETSVRIGVRYLKKVFDRFNGNIVLALAGYNAGPGAAERWIKASAGKHGITEFIETIPYKETRDYVSSIIRNYFWYSKMLKREVPKSLDYFWAPYTPKGQEPPKEQKEEQEE
ncbi:transglycosylase SLT domain-containing protein [Bdellovibrionota bacterium FG-2]